MQEPNWACMELRGPLGLSLPNKQLQSPDAFSLLVIQADSSNTSIILSNVSASLILSSLLVLQVALALFLLLLLPVLFGELSRYLRKVSNLFMLLFLLPYASVSSAQKRSETRTLLPAGSLAYTASAQAPVRAHWGDAVCPGDYVPDTTPGFQSLTTPPAFSLFPHSVSVLCLALF